MSRKPAADEASPAAIERRRGHVRAALADARIEGVTPSQASLEICAAYIRGEIDARDLARVYKER